MLLHISAYTNYAYTYIQIEAHGLIKKKKKPDIFAAVKSPHFNSVEF